MGVKIKKDTGYECKVRFSVNIFLNGRWWVIDFSDLHSHDFLDKIEFGKLLAHRKLSVMNILQVDTFKKNLGLGLLK